MSNLPDTLPGVASTGSAAGRLLPEPEAYELLGRFGIKVPKWRYVASTGEIAAAASEIGCPVVVKVVSRDIVHKSDVGGVRLLLASPEAAVEAGDVIQAAVAANAPEATVQGWLVAEQVSGGVELVAGMLHDPVFGPALMFGSGGILIELLRDVTFRVVPVGRSDVLEMIAETRASKILKGLRGKPPCDVGAVADVLLALSQLVEQTPGISEIDLNPIIAGPGGAVAVDARIFMARLCDPDPRPIA